MIIKLKPILKKENEWQPSEQIFWDEKKLNKIITEEKLNEKMFYIQNVYFNAQSQQLSNVIFDCNNYFNLVKKDIAPISKKGVDYTLSDLSVALINSTLEIKSLNNVYKKINDNEWVQNDDPTPIFEDQLLAIINRFDEVITLNYAPETSDPYIYYIEMKNKKYWAYVVDENYDKGTQVILTLQLDTLSSNLHNFNSNKFKGMRYVERTNNYQVPINYYHSDLCASIDNKIQNIIHTGDEVSTEVDVFVDKKIFDEQTKIVRQPDGGNVSLTVKEHGSVFLDTNTQSFIAYSSTFSVTANFKNTPKLPITMNQLLFKHNSNSVYWDKEWTFPSWEDINAFYTELRESYYNKVGEEENTQLYDITSYANSSNSNNAWISAPKYFKDIKPQVITYAEYQIKNFPEISMLSHTKLHYNYYLIIGKTFKIPLDIFKLNKFHTIYITRIVSLKSIKYNFYYEEERLTVFYTKEITTANDFTGNEFRDWKNNLELQYSNGLKGWQASGFNMLETLAGNLPSVALGGGFAALGLTSIIANTFGLPFRLFQEHQQKKYEKQQILRKGNASSITLLKEALEEILFSATTLASYGFISNANLEISTYFLIAKDYIAVPEIKEILILQEKPVRQDEDKITLDQQRYGNIVNQTFVDDRNPLAFNELTTDHLYWQGKILPDVNPIPSLELDVLNTVLAQGVYIMKEKSEKNVRSLL